MVVRMTKSPGRLGKLLSVSHSLASLSPLVAIFAFLILSHSVLLESL